MFSNRRFSVLATPVVAALALSFALSGNTSAFAGPSVAQVAAAKTAKSHAEKSPVEIGLEAVANQDFEAARVAFGIAAAQDDPLGYYHLGALYQNGLGGDRSRVKALELYRKAAARDVPEAQFALGLFYQHGKAFLEKNAGTAVDWYTKAAAQGSVAAQFNLGMMYATGEAVPVAEGANPDFIKARSWFLVTLDGMETAADRAKVEKIIAELETHMTAGMKDRSRKMYENWIAKTAKN